MKETIDTEDDYRKALVRFLELCESKESTSEHPELLWLKECLEKYETKQC